MVQYLASLAFGLMQLAALLFICVAIEQVGAIERYSLRSRIPGTIFQIILMIFGGGLTWLMQKSWLALGAGKIVVPLYDWLKPLPFGEAIYIFAMFVIVDFLIYWRHRAEHKWFWPIHAVHHAPHELHAANDFGHPLQAIPNLIFIWLPMSLIQLSGPGIPLMVGFTITLLTMYIHSPIDIHFGPLRRLLVDNRFHRIHHSLEPRHFDKNFSVGLSLWDWAFGTAYWPATDEWPLVGVNGVKPPRTVRDFMILPFTMRRSANVNDSRVVSGASGAVIGRPVDAELVQGSGEIPQSAGSI